MTVLASVSRPAATSARASASGTLLRPSCAPPRARAASAATGVEVGGRGTRCVARVGHARPSCGTRTAARACPAASPTSSASSRAGRRLGRLAVDVAHAGRDLEQLARRAAGRYWRTSTTDGCRRVEQQGHDGDGARVAHDVAVERRAVGRLEACRPRRARCGPGGSSARRARRKPRRHRPARRRARRPARARSNGMCGLRPSARASAAPMSSRNSGCGPVGPALELGVGLGADPERVVGQLDELDQAAVGRQARAARSRRPRSATR